MKLSFDTKVLEKLLQSMYRLPNRSVLHLQDEKSCRQFVELIVKCLEGVVSESSRFRPLSESDRWSYFVPCMSRLDSGGRRRGSAEGFISR